MPAASGSWDARRIQGVLFDVDGTLYHQMPVRLCMGAELVAHAVSERVRLGEARALRIVRAFRRVHEECRALGAPEESLRGLLLRETAARTGASAPAVEETVDEWMLRRPCRWLGRFRRRGLTALLEALRIRGLPTGVLSDHPAAVKLRALGVERWFSSAWCTTDPAVNALKPHPRGFLRAAERWGIPPEQILYVGDRTDVDAAGAAAAGMPSAILGASPAGSFSSLLKELAPRG